MVAGSDGLWDNLSQTDIAARVRSCLTKACPPQCLCLWLALLHSQLQWHVEFASHCQCSAAAVSNDAKGYYGC